jgi:hypothetical protein
MFQATIVSESFNRIGPNFYAKHLINGCSYLLSNLHISASGQQLQEIGHWTYKLHHCWFHNPFWGEPKGNHKPNSWAQMRTTISIGLGWELGITDIEFKEKYALSTKWLETLCLLWLVNAPCNWQKNSMFHISIMSHCYDEVGENPVVNVQQQSCLDLLFQFQMVVTPASTFS